MGNLISGQEQPKGDKTDKSKTVAISKHWEVLEKTFQSQILKSKKTSLIVERYWFEIENFQDFDSQNKLFQWRNQNPNSQFMVNVLSVGKDDAASQESSFNCGSIEWCPSEKIRNKVFVVTQRVLKLSELNHVLNFQKQMQAAPSNQKTKILYATEQPDPAPTSDKNSQKIQPFIGINFSETLSRQLLKDWIRGIEVLCYKFGYFNITENHLGMTVHRRGTVWISSNYASNHLNPEERIQVGTAQQKFKFEKQTIHKIMTFAQNIPCFTNTVHNLKQKKVERFDEFCVLLEQISKARKHSRKVTSQQYQQKSQNVSLFVEQGSFLAPNNFLLHNNSSFFVFDHQNAMNIVNSNARINSNEKMVSAEASLHKKDSHLLINSKNSREILRRETQRSNTGEKILAKLSPESRQQINFVSSNHMYCGKETAPTNELGHSSSLHSVNHGVHLKSNFEEEAKKYEPKNMFKSQNNTKVELREVKENFLQKGMSPNKVYFPQNGKHSFSSEPYIFRSHAANDLNSPKSPKNHHNLSFNSPVHFRSNDTDNNYSLDENNMIGPYRKDRVYSNLRREKIVLVDSMVMVREQSEQIEEDLHNLSRGKYLLEESIIIMGKHEDPILSELFP